MKSRKFKQMFSVLLAFALVISLLPSVAFAASEDESSDWVEPVMEDNEIYGIGAEDIVDIDMQQMDEFITRAEFAAMVNNMLGYGALDVPEQTGYADISEDQWYAFDMGAAIALAYIVGYGNGIAAPEDFITREQMAVILCKIFRLASEPDGTSTSFTDISSVSGWAKNAVLAMEQNGYTTGYNNQFMPKKNLTYGEAVQMLTNVAGTIIDENIDAQGMAYGNVVIRKPGVMLRNAVIQGDLFITEGVGDGDIWLDTVQIDGRLLVAGGGENAIQVQNMIAGDNITVNKPSVAGYEPVGLCFLQTNDTVIAIQGIMREIIITEDISINCSMNGQKTEFNLFEAIDETAKPAVLISSDAAVEKIIAFAPVEVIGDGAVGIMEAYASGTVIDSTVYIEPGNIRALENVTIDIGTDVFTGTGIATPVQILDGEVSYESETMPEGEQTE